MALPRAYNRSGAGRETGLTLIEIIVVMGLFTMLAGLTLLATFDSFKGNGFRNERNMLVAVLEEARSQALSNFCLGTCTIGTPNGEGRAHGVSIQVGKYIVFQCPPLPTVCSYATRDAAVDQVITNNYIVTLTGSSEIVFNNFSGDATPAAITIADQAGHLSVINVNSEGQIIWTN